MMAGKLLLTFFVGGVLGTFYDYIHVFFGVLVYEHPHFAGTSLWVPVEFGSAGLLAIPALRVLSRRMPLPRVNARDVWLDATLFFFAYLFSSLLAHWPATAAVAVAAVAAPGLLRRRNRLLTVWCLILGMLGPLSEQLTQAVGLFHYTVGRLPPFLPPLWVSAGTVFVDVAVLIWRDSLFGSRTDKKTGGLPR